MSWWDTSNFSSLATQAIKSAQKKIDRVLDIPEDEAATSSSTTTTPIASAPAATTPSKDGSEDAFFGSWFGTTTPFEEPSTKLSTKRPTRPAGSRLNRSAEKSSRTSTLTAAAKNPTSRLSDDKKSDRVRKDLTPSLSVESDAKQVDSDKPVESPSEAAEEGARDGASAAAGGDQKLSDSNVQSIPDRATSGSDIVANPGNPDEEAQSEMSRSPPQLTAEPPAVRKSKPLRLGSRLSSKDKDEEQKRKEKEAAALKEAEEARKKQEAAEMEAKMQELLQGENAAEDKKQCEYQESVKSDDISTVETLQSPPLQSESHSGSAGTASEEAVECGDAGQLQLAGTVMQSEVSEVVPQQEAAEEPSIDENTPASCQENKTDTLEMDASQTEVKDSEDSGTVARTRVTDVVAIDASMTVSAWGDSELPELMEEDDVTDIEKEGDNVDNKEVGDQSHKDDKIVISEHSTGENSEPSDEKDPISEPGVLNTSIESDGLMKSTESNITSDELSESNRTLTSEDFVDPSKLVEDQGKTLMDSDLSAETCSGSEQTGDSDITVKDAESAAEDEDEKTEMNEEEEESLKDTSSSGPTPGTSPGTKSAGSASSAPEHDTMVSSTMSSSSSIVKTMIEDAMTESLKEVDTHSTGDSSEKSSEMVRIESGHNSGHTSGDEIDTTTSSDIEIISTPTPNGENRVERPFDLSPLRHALSRTVRRGSPPGHKRSDSGSSSQSTWSKNGDDITSPESGRVRATDAMASDGGGREADGRTHTGGHGSGMSDALQTEKLLRSPTRVAPISPTRLCTINEHAEIDLSPPPAVRQEFKLAQKLADQAEVLEAREKKMVELSRENIELQEANAILRNQLQQSEEAREAEMADLNEVTDEFTTRLSEAEQKLNCVIREKEEMKKQLQHTESLLAKTCDSSNATQRVLQEKDQQISELMEEGQKLSKQQLQSNNIIKKLRSKEKENDGTIKTQKQKLEANKTEIEHLKKVLDSKEDLEKRQIDAIHQLNTAVKKMEMEMSRQKTDLEDAQEKNRSLQVALDNSYKEMAGLHKANASKSSEMQTAALSAEVAAKEQLRLTLEKQAAQMKNEQEALITQIEDLRLSLTRQERESNRREDVLRQEISDLQQRLQEGEDRNQELTQSITAATRPLLRQIENLNSTYSAQTATYEKVERNLTDRLSEAQSSLAVASEKERAATEQVMELTARLTTVDAQLSVLRQEKSRLSAQLEMERSKAEVLEDAKNSGSAQLETLQQSYDKKLGDLKKEKLLLEHQLEMEKMRTETEKKKLAMAQDQLNEKDQQLQMRMTRSTPSPRPTSRPISRQASMDQMAESFSSQDEVLERTLSMASSNGTKTSLYETLRLTGAATLVENLEAQLKMREGEILQLQSDILELERTREAMARELVNLTTKNESLQEQLENYPHLEKNHKELNQRYNALLQMYGEKVEETDELRLDLHDVKDMYKLQIEELLKNMSR